MLLRNCDFWTKTHRVLTAGIAGIVLAAVGSACVGEDEYAGEPLDDQPNPYDGNWPNEIQNTPEDANQFVNFAASQVVPPGLDEPVYWHIGRLTEQELEANPSWWGALEMTGDLCAYQSPYASLEVIAEFWDSFSVTEKMLCLRLRYPDHIMIFADEQLVVDPIGGELAYPPDAGNELAAAYGSLNAIPCVEPGTDGYDTVPFDIELTTGTEKIPDNVDAGGCGVWATAMCDRILGLRNGAVTQGEINSIAQELETQDRATEVDNISRYYTSRGYCVTKERFGGSAADYQKVADKLGQGCDIKLFFGKWSGQGDEKIYENGHGETVVGADANDNTITTNSWGSQATIRGGSDGGFDHSGDVEGGLRLEGEPELWPETHTYVSVQYVCTCDKSDKLLDRIQYQLEQLFGD